MKSVKILIIVLCLIIIGLVTFIIVEKIANKNIRSNSMPKDNMTDVENDKTKIMKIQRFKWYRTI